MARACSCRILPAYAAESAYWGLLAIYLQGKGLGHGTAVKQTLGHPDSQGIPCCKDKASCFCFTNSRSLMQAGHLHEDLVTYVMHSSSLCRTGRKLSTSTDTVPEWNWVVTRSSSSK